ncbi:hypothetical protein K502DRAFT_325042 [Neoconidiobolus thromboides FSU 785]|nr:hypothetical protein K502DRAFT_325042 [Neoconidiobolus thromboides FSU 785]
MSFNKTIDEPILEPQQIVEVLRKLEIYIHETQILKPSEMDCLTIFNSISELFLGIGLVPDIEYVRNHFKEYDHILQDLAGLLAYLKRLNEFFKSLNIEPVSYIDLVEPKPKKIIRILSQLINFLRYREFYSKLIDDRIRALNEVSDKLDEKLEENRQMKQYNIDNEITEDEVYQESKINSIIKIDKEEMIMMAKEQEKTSAVHDELREIHTKNRIKIDALEEVIKKGKYIITELSSMIIEDPAKLMESIKKNREDNTKMEQIIAIGMEEINKIKDQINILKDNREELEIRKKLIKELMIQIKRFASLDKKQKEFKDKNETLEKAIGDFKAEEKVLLMEDERITNEVKERNENYKKKREMLSIEKYKSELVKRKREEAMKVADNEKRELHKRLKALEEEKREIVESNDHKVKKIILTNNNLVKKANKFCKLVQEMVKIIK